MSLNLFNQVEQKLKEIAENVSGVRQVSVAEPSLEEGFLSLIHI